MSDENPSIRHLIDQQCDRFEAALKAGQSPAISDFLQHVPATHRESLERQLAALADDYRGRVESGFEQTLDSAAVQSPTQPIVADHDVTIDSRWEPARRTSELGERLKYFGDYEILSEIARGGMGVVYRARQTTLGRIVALKMILSGELAGQREIARFQSEAEAAANLDHPGIVPIYEVGRHGEHHYFSMGLIVGQSLSERLREGPMESRPAAECLEKIARAVGYANEKGVIHRDLKPGNILLDEDGDPHVTDFGLAKRLQSDSELTTSGEVLGTPAYMPPEQARGDLEAIGPASDIYSLGAILYAMLAGRPPHAAASMVETLRQVIEVDAVSVRSLSPSTPRDLETICAKCLAKEPSKRYASANDLADELARFLRGEPILARPISRIERTWRWARRRPTLAALSTVLAALILGLAVGGPIVAINQARLKKQAQDNEARASTLAASERDAKDRSNHALYARTVSLAFEELQSGNLTGAEDLLASLSVSDRGFEWRYVQSLCRQELQAFLDMRSPARFVELPSDGIHVLAAGAGGDTKTQYVWRMGDPIPVAIRDGRGLGVSTDGRSIALVPPDEPKKFQIVDAVTGQVRQTMAGHVGGVFMAAFGGPEQSMIATIGRDKTYRLWSVESGKELVKITNPFRRRLHPIALSPDGKTIAWRRGDDGAIELRDTSAGEVIFEGPADRSLAGRECPIAFSPDGSLVAVGGLGEVVLIDSASGASTGTLSGLRAYALCLDFSPDGNRLATGSQDGTIRIFDIARRKLLTSITGHKSGSSYGVKAIAFDDTGDRLVSGGYDAEVKVWNAWNGDRESSSVVRGSGQPSPSPSQSADFVTVMPSRVQSLRYSSDGRYLLAAGHDKTASVIDAESGAPIRSWNELDGHQSAIDFDPQAGLVLVGGGAIDDRRAGAVVALDLESGESVWRFGETGGPVSAVRFFDSGTRIAVGVGNPTTTIGNLIVLDAKTGKPIWRNQIAMLPVFGLDVAPDASTLATVGLETGITLWDARSGKKLGRMGDRDFFSVAYSADGSRLATGGGDWSVRLFQRETGAELWSQIRHTGVVTQIAFASDDTRLVSTAVDGYTRIWDTRYGDSILQLRDSDQENLALAVSADARSIAVSGLNPTIVLRRTPVADASDRIAADGTLADADSWVTIAQDDFGGHQMSDQWNPVGQWTVTKGVMTGTLAPTPYGITAVNFALKRMLPTDFEVTMDVSIDSPMVVEAKVSDLKATNAISALFVGMNRSPFNRAEKGVAVVQTSRGSYRELGSRREGSFSFEIGRTYRLTTRRLGDRLDLSIDGELYRTIRLSTKTPMPMLSLQGMFGKTDGKISIDNVTVKVPPAGLVEMDAVGVVAQAYLENPIKPLVIAELRSLEPSAWGDRPTEARAVGLELASNWYQRDADILAATESMAIAGDADPAEYRALLDWTQEKITVKDQRTHRASAMCAFRLGDRAAAWEALKQAKQMHQAKMGHWHPVDLALSAMLLWEGGKHDIAKRHLRQVDQMMLSQTWSDDPTSSAWAKIARETVQAEPDDDIFAALAEATWKQEHARVVLADAGPLEEILADEAVMVIERVAGDTEYAVTINRDQWVRCEQIWAIGGVRALDSLTRVDCVISDGYQSPTTQRPVVTSRFVRQNGDGSFTWVQEDTFQREPSVAPEQWKIVKRAFRFERIAVGPETHNVVRDGWDELDRMVDVASKGGNTPEKLFRLIMANRIAEALAVARQIATESDEAVAWAHLAELAQWNGDSETLMLAAKKAVEKDPMVRGTPAIRAIAAKKWASDKPFEFAPEATVRVPSFLRWASTDLLAAGDGGLGSWQATADSLVGIIRLPTDEDSPVKDYADAIIASRKVGFGMETFLRRSREVDGFPAHQFIQRGLGVGRAVTKSGKPTIQNFVLVRRNQDTFMFFVSAYEDDFERRNAEFEQLLEMTSLSKTKSPAANPNSKDPNSKDPNSKDPNAKDPEQP